MVDLGLGLVPFGSEGGAGPAPQEETQEDKAMKKEHKPVEGRIWGTWRCSCGWKPSARCLAFRRGYESELTAVSMHVAEKKGRLCVCDCDVDYHYAGHGQCKNEASYMGPQCRCKKFRRKRAS